MIAWAAQAAAEYVGALLANGVQAVERGAQDAGRWLGQHPVEAGAAILTLFLLARVFRRS